MSRNLVHFLIPEASRSFVTISSSEKPWSTGRLSSGVHKFLKVPPCGAELTLVLVMRAALCSPSEACPVITVSLPHLETISCLCLRQWLSGSVTLVAALCSG